MTRFSSLSAAHEYIDELEEELQQLRDMLKPQAQFPHEWSLTRREREILRCLVTRPEVTRDQLMLLIYGGMATEKDIRNIDQNIKRIRGKFEKYNVAVQIEAIYGVGYSMRTKDRQYLKSFLVVDN